MSTAAWYRTGALAVAGLQLADLATTFVVFSLGGYEANGVAAWLLARHLLIPVKLLVAGWVVTAAFRFERRLAPRDAVAMWLVAAVYVGVVGWNVSRVAVHLTA